MQADLEFEYPHKIAKIKVRADLLKWLDEEEERVKMNLKEGILQLDEEALSGKTSKKVDLMEGYILTYEDYYKLDDFVGIPPMSRTHAGKMPYEEFAKQMASDRIFDNDVSLVKYFSLYLFSFWNNNTSFGSLKKIERPVSRCSG